MPGAWGGGERPHVSRSRSNSFRRAVASFRRLLLLWGFHSVTRQIQLQDYAMVDEAIDRRRCRHPLRQQHAGREVNAPPPLNEFVSQRTE